LKAGIVCLVLGYVLSQFYRAFLAVLSPDLIIELGGETDFKNKKVIVAKDLLKSFVDEKIQNGISIILDIDVQGFNLIRNAIEHNLSIFIIPPSIKELRKRLTSRGLDSSDVIEKRLSIAKTELKYAEQYDYIVLNDLFENTLSELVSIINDENYIYDRETNINLLKDLLD